MAKIPPIAIPAGLLLLGAAVLTDLVFSQNPTSAQPAATQGSVFETANLDGQSIAAEIQTPDTAAKYIGNNYSRKFHRKSCPFAQMMWQSRKQCFEHRHDAIDLGYKPCRYCLPRVWTSVHATILNRVLIHSENPCPQLRTSKDVIRQSQPSLTPSGTGTPGNSQSGE